MTKLFIGTSDSFKELIGKTIDEIVLDKSRENLYFYSKKDDLWFHYYAYGDCCSNSWFEHVGSDLADDQPVKVFSVLEREMPPDDNNSKDNECLAFYGWSLVTDRGYLDIEMRNSSNGYYGGSVQFEGNQSPEKVAIQKQLDEEKYQKQKSFVIRDIMGKALVITSHIDAKNIIALCGEKAHDKIVEELGTVRTIGGLDDIPVNKNLPITLTGPTSSVLVLKGSHLSDDDVVLFVPWNLVSHRLNIPSK